MHTSETTIAAETPPTTRHRPETAESRTTGGGARSETDARVDAVRAAASDVGERVPELISSVRAGAADGARTIQAWPEPNQRLLAVFSAGVGVGLMIAGAPRLLVAGALVPAFAVAATAMGNETRGARQPR